MLRSPYPVILAGDFNDLPYSFAYQCFSNYFDNSFEEAGQFLGVSFRGSIPGLRIDNQFSQPGLAILDHKVLYDFQYTDHFPILVTYDLN